MFTILSTRVHKAAVAANCFVAESGHDEQPTGRNLISTSRFGLKTRILALLAFALTAGIWNTAFGQGELIQPIAGGVSGTVNNDVSLVYDGVFPDEGSGWTGATNVWWSGQTGSGGFVIELDLEKVHLVNDAEMSFDNNSWMQHSRYIWRMI